MTTTTLSSLKTPPLVGCLPELRRDRLGFLMRAWRDGGGFVRAATLPGRCLYVITEPELARQVLVGEASRFKKFAALSKYARPILGDGLITSEGSHHRQQRKLIAPGLKRKQIAKYAEAMTRHTAVATQSWADGQVVDIHAEMTRLTLAIATETMFHTPSEAYARIASRAVHAGTTYIAGEVGRLIHLPVSWPLPRNLRMRRAVAALDRIVYDIVGQRRAAAEGHDDILQMLLDAQDEDDGRRMTDEQVRDEVMTLFVAGHETTANALSWSFYLLARNPEVQDELAGQARAVLAGRPPTVDDLKDLPLAAQVFKESMRLYPPAYMVGREAREPVELGGHTIEAGAMVLVSIYGIHRRPDLHPDPERFDPERFTAQRESELPRGAYLPFADGPRVCIGNHFALMEGQIALAHAAQQLRFEPPATEVPPLPRVTLRPAGPIQLTARRAVSV